MSHLTEPPLIERPPQIKVWDSHDPQTGFYLRLSLFGDLGILLHVHQLIHPHELSPYRVDGSLPLGFLCANGALIHCETVNFRLLLFGAVHTVSLDIDPPLFNPHLFNAHLRNVEDWLGRVYFNRREIMTATSETGAALKRRLQQGPSPRVEAGP